MSYKQVITIIGVVVALIVLFTLWLTVPEGAAETKTTALYHVPNSMQVPSISDLIKITVHKLF